MNWFALIVHEKKQPTNIATKQRLYFSTTLYFSSHIQRHRSYTWTVDRLKRRCASDFGREKCISELNCSSSDSQIQTDPIVFLHVILLHVIIIGVSLNVVNYQIRYTILYKYYTPQ